MSNPFATSKTIPIFQLSGRIHHDEMDEMLVWCYDNGASDITIASDRPVWCDVSGNQLRATSRNLTYTEARECIRWIYASENGPGEVNMGHDLDPSYEVKVKNRDTDRLRFRVNITGGRIDGGRGAQITIRTLPPTPIEISKLGIEAEIIENLRPAQGLNLITGPTGSGKSTLLASAVRYICEQPNANEKVIEYSKPIEFVYDDLQDKFPSSHIWQTEVGDHLRPKENEGHEGSIWAYAIRNAMRRKPTMILLGEARDAATIQGCIEAALTGHLVKSTMHTIGVPETIRRAIQPFPGSERRGIAADLLECMNLAVTQLLLPRKGGGRVGCREYLIFDRKVRSALISLDPDDWSPRLREMLRDRQGITGRSMADHAKELFQQDIITSETYEWIASRTAKESKVVREALSGGIFSALNEDEDT